MERIRIYEKLRGLDLLRAPKESYPVYGFLAGPVSIETTTKTRLWCRWPYEGHPSGCPNCGLKKTGCPGGKDSELFNSKFSPEAYLLGVVGDFGAYLKSRQKEQNGLGVFGSKEMKNKRWYQSTMDSWLLKWSKVIGEEYSDLAKSGWMHFVDNAEARGVDFGKVCKDAEVAVLRVSSLTLDRKIVKTTFSKAPVVTSGALASYDKPFVVENYFLPGAGEIIAHFEQGGEMPMWRMALIAKSLTS